jgi:hypothetical protein
MPGSRAATCPAVSRRSGEMIPRRCPPAESQLRSGSVYRSARSAAVSCTVETVIPDTATTRPRPARLQGEARVEQPDHAASAGRLAGS